jgi:glycosyltransferase involved in cell wall biosynthesis
MMKVIVLGLRAIPGVAGGVESHSEHLYPLLAESGIDVEILVRSPYADPSFGNAWRGVRIRRLWSPQKSGIEAVIHTFLGVLYAAVRRPDILHIHSIGPAIFTPLARLLGLRVIVTCHAPDYMQAKWSRSAKWLLRTGERMAMRHATEVISVSEHGAASLSEKYGRGVNAIMNGVPRIDLPASSSVVQELGLEPGRYVLHVGRAIPDKRQDDLIEAFSRTELPGWKLVLVGDLSGEDKFSANVRAAASGNPSVVLAGFRCGDDLRALFCNAGCFALPSAVEGFPIALLEALSAGCPVVASDIPANHEIELPPGCYFPVGDTGALAAALATVPSSMTRGVWAALRRLVRVEYDWQRIAEQTAMLYSRVAASGTDKSSPTHPRIARTTTLVGSASSESAPRQP